MQKCSRVRRVITLVVVLSYVQALLLPQLGLAQAANCGFDKAKPSLENARLSFKVTNYACAEAELQALLARADLQLEVKADAHVLMAAVCYAKLRNTEEKESRVVAEFVAAFKAFRDWRGELDIKSPEFEALMLKAQNQVAEEVKVAEESAAATAPELVKATPPPPPTQPEIVDTWSNAKTGKKPWFKKWWVIGLGVGLVGTAVAMGGGGSEDGTNDGGGGGDVHDPPLSGFPPTP